MANHNQNGGRSAPADDSRSSWRPQDPSSQGTHGRDVEDDRGDYRSWRDRGSRDDQRPTGEREPRRWDTGRQGDDRSQQLAGGSDMPSAGSFEDRYHDDRYRDPGTDDRSAGRARPGYWQDRTGHDLDRYSGQGGHDFEAERRGLARAGHGYGERTGYPAGSYGRGSTGYGPAVQDIPPRNAGPEPHVHRGTGPHRGKGPSGYQRSDERIRELVCESLADDDQVDATHFEVAVSHGEVTLSGIVDDRRAKRDAEDCVWSVSGVRDVQNRLRVVRDDRATLGNSPSNPSSNPAGQTPVESNDPETSVQDAKHRA